MELRARAMVDGYFSGRHRSRQLGGGADFADHRNYSPGDELRHLDWKLYGRTDRHFIKRFSAETAMNVLLAVDTSGSMGYASGEISKLRFAAFLAAGLAWLAHCQGDAPGLVLLADGVRHYTPPRSGPGQLQHLFKQLETASAGGETSLSAALGQLAAMTPRRGMIVFISDLWDDPDSMTRALKHFRHRGHDVIVLHVLDRAERRFEFKGTVLFEDMETRQEVQVDADDMRRTYLDELQEFIAAVAGGCRSAAIDYHLVETCDSFHETLGAYLARRNRNFN